MPAFTTLLLFAVAAISVNLTPGPDMLYVIARSIGGGRWSGIVSALGLSIGYIVYTVLAASGIAALLLSFPAAYGVIRVVGAAYLTYLGGRTLLQRGEPLPDVVAVGATVSETAIAPLLAPANGMLTPAWLDIFRQGALTSLLNPSITIFFLAFLPQFVDPVRGPVFTQIVALGLLFTTTATTVHALIALLTGTAGDWLRRREGAGRWQRLFSGVVLILLGMRVLFQF